MKITFVSTKKNLDPTERELYEMDLLVKALGFERAFLDLGMYTVMACTPAGTDVELVDEYLQPIDYSVKTVLRPHAEAEVSDPIADHFIVSTVPRARFAFAEEAARSLPGVRCVVPQAGELVSL